MICSKCNMQNEKDSKFCTTCGNILSLTPVSHNPGSVDTYFMNKENACILCGYIGDVKYTEIYQNIGMLVMRQHRSIKGNLCKDCIKKTFWEYTPITLFLGWWGTISFFVTPLILINNTGRYLFSLNMKAREV